MKKILFVNKSFAVGGIQTSMINMINVLSKKYEIYLFLYYPEGPLKERLNPNVKIIDSNKYFKALGMSFKNCMKKGDIKQKVFRITMTIWSRIFNNKLPLKIAMSRQKKIGKFDYAIAYHHEFGKHIVTSGFNRLLINCVDAEKKISWIHNDAVANPTDESFNDKYYSVMDKIVCVSNAVKKSFSEKHPNIDSNKIEICYNFLDCTRIDRLAKKHAGIDLKKHKIIFFSACRLVSVKGFPRAIKAFSGIFEHNDIVWYIAGEGNERSLIEKTIKKYNLEDKIILLGNLENPYCYIKQADVLLLCSYYEAAPMLYSEAKYFKKPVFTTKVSSSIEMLKTNKYGFICENDETSMKIGFEKIVKDKSIIEKIKQNLENVELSENSMIREFENIVR